MGTPGRRAQFASAQVLQICRCSRCADMAQCSNCKSATFAIWEMQTCTSGDRGQTRSGGNQTRHLPAPHRVCLKSLLCILKVKRDSCVTPGWEKSARSLSTAIRCYLQDFGAIRRISCISLIHLLLFLLLSSSLRFPLPLSLPCPVCHRRYATTHFGVFTTIWRYSKFLRGLT